MHIEYLEEIDLKEVWKEAAELKDDAFRLQHQGNTAEAIEKLQEALSCDENDIETLTLLGKAYFVSGNNAAAEPYFLRAYDESRCSCSNGRADPDLSMAVGRLYLQTGRYRPAYRKFSEAKYFRSHREVASKAMDDADYAQLLSEREADKLNPEESLIEGVRRTACPESFPERICNRHPRPGCY